MKKSSIFLLLLLAATPAVADGINPGVYLAVGDSITQGHDSNAWWSRGYLPYLADLLEISESQIVNAGVGGATSLEGLDRWGYRETLRETMPQYVLILFGTNDISQQIPPGETIETLRQMVDAARTVGSIPLLGSVIPRAAHDQDSDNHDALVLNGMIGDLAWSTAGTGLADHFTVFLDNPCAPLDCGPDDPEYYVEDDPYDLCCYYSDALHPSQQGYELIGQSWFDALVTRGSDPPPAGDYAAPWVAWSIPEDGENGVPPESHIIIRLDDLGQGVDGDSIQLTVDGATVPHGSLAIGGTPDSLEITYTPEIPFTAGMTVEASIGAEDLANPPNRLESHTWSFRISGGDGVDFGDIDGSGRVDGHDLALLGHAFGSVPGDSRWLAEADLNGDGVVDGEDLARLAAWFGETF